MKKKLLFFCYLAIAGCSPLYAQQAVFGAKSAGLGDVSAVEDGWSVFNNSAQMVFQSSQCVLQYKHFYDFVPAYGVAAAYLQRLNTCNAVGVGCVQIAAGDFRQRAVVAAFAHDIAACFSLSLQCQYLFLSYTDAWYGLNHGLFCSLSACYRPDELWCWSLVWGNPAQFHYRFDKNADVLPSFLRIGMRYIWTSQLRTYVECDKTMQFPLAVAFGMEREIGTVQVSVGARFPTFQLCVGVGADLNRMGWSVACQYHMELGAVWAFSLYVSV